MADLKYHWAIPVSDQSKHRNIQACGRKYTTALAETAVLFMAKVKANSDWYCSDCARAARLALAKESAPKPADVVWPKPRPISEADPNTRYLCWFPSIREWLPSYPANIQHHWSAVHCASHFLPLPPEVK